MAKVARTLKRKESVRSKSCEPFGKYREKPVQNWDACAIRYATASFHVRRAESATKR
jgi:hypothetical protein